MCDALNEDYTDERIKHLEMIHEVIVYFASCSARVRHLTISLVWTVFMGFLGVLVGTMSMSSTTRGSFGTKEAMSVVLVILILSVITAFYAWLDVQYFLRGKQFQEFYDRVRAQPSSRRPDFCMTVPPDIMKKGCLCRGAILKSVILIVLLYIILMLYYAVATVAALNLAALQGWL